MHAEMRALRESLERPTLVEHGRRVFASGLLFGKPVVLVESRIGKVAAAAAATELIVRFNTQSLLFTGLAGGLNPSLAIGDIVVANALCHHDLDASPLFPAMEIPLLGLSHIPTDADWTARLHAGAAGYLRDHTASPSAPLAGRAARPAQVSLGLITSGDRFVSSDAEVARLRTLLPDALCVEMEGAAVAQVAWEYGIPLGVVRTISDSADDHAAAAFPASLDAIAASASHGVLERALSQAA